MFWGYQGRIKKAAPRVLNQPDFNTSWSLCVVQISYKLHYTLFQAWFWQVMWALAEQHWKKTNKKKHDNSANCNSCIKMIFTNGRKSIASICKCQAQAWHCWKGRCRIRINCCKCPDSVSGFLWQDRNRNMALTCFIDNRLSFILCH